MGHSLPPANWEDGTLETSAMVQFSSRQILVWSSLASTVAFASLFQLPAQSIQLADGTTYFANVPRLENARTTFNRARVFGATYHFTLHLPEDAGEPLQRVLLKQQEGVDRVLFNLKRTRAYADERQKLPIEIANVSMNEEGAVMVAFDPPVQPGETIMISLRPYRNPNTSGVYLFGVTAFPQGEQAHGQFLGYGRLHFYDPFRQHLFWGR